MEAQQRLHKVIEERVKKNRERQRQAASRGQLLNLAMGDYVMVARVRRPGSTPKLVTTWTGPWRIVTADKVHVYDVQSIVTSEVKDVYVVRLRFYADKDLERTAASKEVFYMPSHRACLRWPGSSPFRRPRADRVLTSRWIGLDSTRKRVFVGVACDYMERHPAVCQVGVAEVEA